MILDELVVPVRLETGLLLEGIRFIDSALKEAVGFFATAAKEAARVDELAIVNEVLAQNAGIAVDVMKAETSEVHKMGIEWAVSNQVVAQFMQSHLDLAKASDIARIAQDAAVISGKNSTEATKDMIWGITTLNTKVLRNNGIAFTAAEAYEKYAKEMNVSVDSMTQADKQAAFLNMTLSKGVDIAGAYEAAMTEPAKVLRSIPRYVNDVMVAVGKNFKEAFGNVVFTIADFAKSLGKAVEEGGALAPVMKVLGDLASEITKNFKEWVTNINWEDVSDWIQREAIPRLKNLITTYEEVRDKVIQIKNEVQNWFSNNQYILDAIKTKWGELKSSVHDLYVAIAHLFGYTEETAPTLAQLMTTAFQTIYVAMHAVKLVIDGIVIGLNGIRSAIDWINSHRVSADFVPNYPGIRTAAQKQNASYFVPVPSGYKTPIISAPSISQPLVRLTGYASGGSFKVGGSGGIDSQLVQFMATPGERVSISNNQKNPFENFDYRLLARLLGSEVAKAVG